MDWSTIIAALISGLGGVALGAVISTKQHHDVQARLDCASARVVYFELAENTSYLDTSINRGVSMPLRVATWAPERNRLANVMTAGDFAIVATAFMKLGATAEAWKLTPHGTTIGVGSMQAAKEVLVRVEQAAAALYPHAWPNETDRAALDAQLREHVRDVAAKPGP